MKPKDALPRSQAPTIGPHPGWDEHSTKHVPTNFIRYILKLSHQQHPSYVLWVNSTS